MHDKNVNERPYGSLAIAQANKNEENLIGCFEAHKQKISKSAVPSAEFAPNS